jgi:hypothetical protein
MKRLKSSLSLLGWVAYTVFVCIVVLLFVRAEEKDRGTNVRGTFT